MVARINELPQKKHQKVMTRATPLSVRFSQAEKNTITEIASSLKTSRNNFVRTACFAMARELREENLVSAQK